MRTSWVHVEGVDARQRVHDCVDADGSHELADQRVTDVELQVVGASQVVTGLAGVDADHLGDAWVFRQALHEQCSPPASDSSDQNAPFLSGHLQSQYVLFITSRSICATAAETVSRSGDFAVRRAHSSWRSSE